MIEPTRREILHELERLSEAPRRMSGSASSIANLSYLAVGPTNEAVWDMEETSSCSSRSGSKPRNSLISRHGLGDLARQAGDEPELADVEQGVQDRGDQVLDA